jgi:hypothetical protein
MSPLCGSAFQAWDAYGDKSYQAARSEQNLTNVELARFKPGRRLEAL